jgi:cell division septation protein DedD
LASHTEDDGFHEIQLNGKQLVFLFMAATVVSVVIFLCGVLVGRGVKAERIATAAAAPGEAESRELIPAGAAMARVPTPAGVDPTVAAPPPTAGEDLSYFERLGTKNQPKEQLKAVVSERARNVPAPEKPPSPAPVAAAPKDRLATPASAPASKVDGYAVQVAALNVRSEADAIARRLTAKGYSAYVQAPANGTPAVYRVRVGTFKTKREAETMATKLQKEEQFKPWVTR